MYRQQDKLADDQKLERDVQTATIATPNVLPVGRITPENHYTTLSRFGCGLTKCACVQACSYFATNGTLYYVLMHPYIAVPVGPDTFSVLFVTLSII